VSLHCTQASDNWTGERTVRSLTALAQSGAIQRFCFRFPPERSINIICICMYVTTHLTRYKVTESRVSQWSAVHFHPMFSSQATCPYDSSCYLKGAPQLNDGVGYAYDDTNHLNRAYTIIFETDTCADFICSSNFSFTWVKCNCWARTSDLIVEYVQPRHKCSKWTSSITHCGNDNVMIRVSKWKCRKGS